MSPHRLAINLSVAVFAMLEAFSVPLVYFGWVKPQRLIARSSTWIAVPCTVIASVSGGEAGFQEGGYKHVFEYTVRGKTYRSTRSTFGGAWADFRYRDGSRVMGLVDPAQPEEAVLRPDIRPQRFELIAILAWLSMASWGLVYYLAIRLNVFPIAMWSGAGRKRYYGEM
jgi:hypothetical protein